VVRDKACTERHPWHVGCGPPVAVLRQYVVVIKPCQGAKVSRQYDNKGRTQQAMDTMDFGLHCNRRANFDLGLDVTC